jgi:hypothetical protein
MENLSIDNDMLQIGQLGPRPRPRTPHLSKAVAVFVVASAAAAALRQIAGAGGRAIALAGAGAWPWAPKFPPGLNLVVISTILRGSVFSHIIKITLSMFPWGPSRPPLRPLFSPLSARRAILIELQTTHFCYNESFTI